MMMLRRYKMKSVALKVMKLLLPALVIISSKKVPEQNHFTR